MQKIKSIGAFLSLRSKREKFILYCTTVFVLGAFLDRLIISPISSKMKYLDREIKQKQTDIKRSLHILAYKDKIKDEVNRYASYLAKGESEEEETTSLLKEIEGLAGKASVYLIDLKPAGSKTEGSSKKYYANINCESQMEQLAHFVYLIETSDKLLAIEKYHIVPKAKESSVAKWGMTISKIIVP